MAKAGRIPEAKWEWFGMAGHLIVGDRCRHHLCTRVGKYLISTVGDYRPEHGKRETIGAGRYFETYVFNLGHKIMRCDCGCNLPRPVEMSEIDALSANDHATAEKNHIKLCRKYAAKRKPG